MQPRPGSCKTSVSQQKSLICAGADLSAVSTAKIHILTASVQYLLFTENSRLTRKLC